MRRLEVATQPAPFFMPRYQPGTSAPETQLAARLSAAVLTILDEWDSEYFDFHERESFRLQLRIEDTIRETVERWIAENDFEK